MSSKIKIENTPFYKNLSELSNSGRGRLFEEHSLEIEKVLNVKLVKHSFAEFGELRTNNNAIITYQENPSTIALMEFVPQ